MPSPRLLSSTALRLALVYLGLFLASALVILAVIYWFTAGFIDRQTNETIAAEIAGLNEQYRQRGLAGLARVVAERSAVRRTDTLYLLAGPDLRPIAGNLSGWPEEPPDARGWIAFTVDDVRGGAPRAHRARAVTFELPGGYRLLVGHDMQEREAFRERVVLALAWALLLTVGLGALGGVLVTRGLLRRIDGINRTTAKIMAGAMDERVAVGRGGDEFDRLASNLNAMLDQIGSLMAGLRHVGESIAHDLRTPLTRMRSRLELAQIEAEDPEELRAALQDAVAEIDRLLATFAALLEIAAAEAGTRAGGFGPVPLRPLVEGVAELYQPVADEKGIALAVRCDGEPAVAGNDQLLSQAVANLLDNAVKYTPAGGRVTLAVAGDGNEARVVVADTGPGIPAHQREAALRRFVRLEPSRNTPGNGLGLSLVDAVARLHGARLVLEDGAPGLRAVLVFPAPSEPPAGRAEAEAVRRAEP